MEGAAETSTEANTARLAHTHTAAVSACVVATNSPPGDTAIDVAARGSEYLPRGEGGVLA